MISYAAPARVGILGNPSDGYGGRTLSLAVPQFEARVTLEPVEAEGIEIVVGPDDQPTWRSVDSMVEHLDHHGYGTGSQLLAAAVRTFVAVIDSIGGSLEAEDGPGFRLSYETTIPRQVGLGGSSALVVAALRCLGQHYRLDIPDLVLPSVALRAETTQLGINAGLQDRVVQTYGGLVAMDFGDMQVDPRFGVHYGSYERLDPSVLPPLFLAYREAAAKPSYIYHQHLRTRYENADPTVREILRELAALVLEGRAALRWGPADRIGSLISRNMALRRSLGPLPPAQVELVEVAEAVGSNATFAGSGGAIVGTYNDDDHLEALADAFADIGADLVKLDLPAPALDGDDGGAGGGADGADGDNTGAGAGAGEGGGGGGGGTPDCDQAAPANVVALDRPHR